MTDRSVVRFNLAWRGRLMTNVVFHADFARPKPKNPDNEGKDEDNRAQLRAADPISNASQAALFGNSYVLQINSGYALLSRCAFDENGNPVTERLPLNNPSIRLQENDKASFELRCDRTTGTIALHIDGTPAIEWTEPPANAENGYAGKGGGFGFFCQGPDCALRVSDLVIADWNGMPDTARSMRSATQDMALLTNGTDRFSGKVTGLASDSIQIESRFGEFKVPLSDLAELRFASDLLASPPAEDPPNTISVRLHPIGTLTGTPVRASPGQLTLLTPHAGEITVNLDSAVMIDFEPFNQPFDDWDPPL